MVGQPFDREDTRKLSRRLHRAYFESIVEALELDLDSLGFASGSAGQVAAFVPRATSIVHLDEQLDFWTFTVTHLLAVAACKRLSDDERCVLLDLFAFACEPELFAERHDESRARFQPWMHEHDDCLELSHALSRAMLVFVICHELGHAALGHTKMQASLSHEHEADELAIRYLSKIQRKGTNVRWIFLHEKLLCAPVLLFRILAFSELVTAKRTGEMPSSTTHPSPNDRAARVEAQLDGVLLEGARYVLDGFSKALDGIWHDLNLSQSER